MAPPWSITRKERPLATSRNIEAPAAKACAWPVSSPSARMTRCPSLGAAVAVGGIWSTSHNKISPWRYCRGIGSLLSAVGQGSAIDRDGVDEFQGSAHLPIRAAPRELGGERPEVDLVFPAKGTRPEPVLLMMVMTAEAHAKDVVRHLAGPGIGGRTQMGKVDPPGRTT